MDCIRLFHIGDIHFPDLKAEPGLIDRKDKGFSVIISNANHGTLQKLYPKAKIMLVKRISCVSRKIGARKEIMESVFVL